MKKEGRSIPLGFIKSHDSSTPSTSLRLCLCSEPNGAHGPSIRRNTRSLNPTFWHDLRIKASANDRTRIEIKHVQYRLIAHRIFKTFAKHGTCSTVASTVACLFSCFGPFQRLVSRPIQVSRIRSGTVGANMELYNSSL